MAHVIIHFEIPADDITRARRFYGELFGWTFRERLPVQGEAGRYLLVETGGKPNGGVTGRTPLSQGILTYFLVEDLDEYVRRARALGATILSPSAPLPGVGWWAVIRDPEGNALALWQDDLDAQ